MRPILLLFSLVVSKASCGFAATETELISKVFGGAENLAIVKNAREVTACIITPKKDPDGPGVEAADFEDPGNFREGPRVVVPVHRIAQLRAVLLDPAQADVESRKSCIPVPHVRFIFTDSSGSVGVDLCFLCDILYVSRGGKMVGGENFDPAHAKLLALCRALFPGDKDLDELAKNLARER
jgi:hypothetical protein